MEADREHQIRKALRERAEEEEARKQGEWFAALVPAVEKWAPRIHQLLQTAERQLDYGFPEGAIVTAFTALELCGTKIVVETMFRTITWPFEEFGDQVASLIFGRNGKLQQLPRLLKYGPALDYPSDEMWKRLGQQQELRNRIVHLGERASEDEARRVVESVKLAVDEILLTLNLGRLSEWTGS